MVMDKSNNGDIDMVDDDDNNEESEGFLGVGGAQQPMEERRTVRSVYRDIIHNLNENQQELIQPESSKLTETLENVQQIFKTKVKMTREAALDSQAMAIISSLGRQKAQQLNTELLRFEPLQFASKVVNFITEENVDLDDEDAPLPEITKDQWETFGEAVQPFFLRSPPLTFMLGSFKKGPPPKKPPKQKPIKDPLKPVKKQEPQQVTAKETTNEESTTKEVERILTILHKIYYDVKNDRQPIDFYEFVINPHSFAKTVENIFHTAFLIKDGIAKIYLDEDGLPVIEPVEQDEDAAQNEHAKDQQVRHQQVMVITMDEWERIKEVYKIREPLIPPARSKSSSKSKK